MFYENLAKKLVEALPPGLQQLQHDMEQQFSDILNAAFARMNLVTREEFDVQVKVLARSREKVDALEKTVNQLLQEKNKTKKK